MRNQKLRYAVKKIEREFDKRIMKFCPICKTRYDEEILRFCTKDGTPLIEEGQPNFTALPSEDDLGEQTVIRRKTPPPIPSTAQPVPDFDNDEPERISSPRIVIPMSVDVAEPEELPRSREPVRAKTTESIRRQPPQKSNTAMVVFLTVLGTIVVLAGATGIFYFLSSQNSSGNQNVNYNTNFNSIDLNINANLGVDNSLVNFNSSINTNANANANANLKTPTPTRTPTPTPTATPNVNANNPINMDTNALPPANTRPTPPRPSPSATPARPTPSETPSDRPVNAGILNSRAVTLPKPAYPPIAKQMRAAGQVTVQVLMDEAGNVTAARATSGNPLLRAPAEAAARQSKFSPVRVGSQAVKASGIVLYNFVNQ
jgi:TonB family protein